MLRKATPKKAAESFFEMIRFYKVSHLPVRAVCCLSSVTAVHAHTAFGITQQHRSPNRILVLIAPIKTQMSLLYRSAHAQTLGDCSLSTESIIWIRKILRISSDNFLTFLKDWSMWHRNRVFLQRTDLIFLVVIHKQLRSSPIVSLNPKIKK
jgi:hypothetical protein